MEPHDTDQPEFDAGDRSTDRRTFLKRGAGWAALLSATQFFYPGSANALSRTAALRGGSPGLAPQGGPKHLTMVGPDPTFARGEVTAITDNGVLVENVARSRAIIWPAGMTVWKEFFVPVSEIKIGDTVSAAGRPQGDGSLLADLKRAWVNIGIRDGTFDSAATDHINMRSRAGQLEPVYLSTALEVIHVDTGDPISNGLSALRPGQNFGAVGLVLPNGTFRATRVWFDPSTA